MGLIIWMVQFWIITGIAFSVLALPFVLLGSLGSGTGVVRGLRLRASTGRGLRGTR